MRAKQDAVAHRCIRSALSFYLIQGRVRLGKIVPDPLPLFRNAIADSLRDRDDPFRISGVRQPERADLLSELNGQRADLFFLQSIEDHHKFIAAVAPAKQ